MSRFLDRWPKALRRRLDGSTGHRSLRGSDAEPQSGDIEVRPEADAGPAAKPPKVHRPRNLPAVVRDGDATAITLDPRQGGSGIYWVLKNLLLGPGVRQVFQPVEEGVSNVPETGAAILASNHLSYADWLFMPLALDRRVTFIAKSDYFDGVGVKGWAQKRFFAGTGQVPVDRSGGRAAEGALRAGRKVLDRGELFGIYPEGTRSHDGRLYKGRTGVARLALEARVPVIPTAVIGTDVIAPPGKIVKKIISPTVRFGPPLDFSRYEGLSEDRHILRSVTDEIMYAIMELSGQTYVDLYAPQAKEQAAADARQRDIDETSPQA